MTRAINLQAWWRLTRQWFHMAVEVAGHDGGPYNFQLVGPTRVTGKFGMAYPSMAPMTTHLHLVTKV